MKRLLKAKGGRLKRVLIRELCACLFYLHVAAGFMPRAACDVTCSTEEMRCRSKRGSGARVNL